MRVGEAFMLIRTRSSFYCNEVFTSIICDFFFFSFKIYSILSINIDIAIWNSVFNTYLERLLTL